MTPLHQKARHPIANLQPRAVCAVLYHPDTRKVLGVSRGKGSNQWACVGGKVDWLEKEERWETAEEAMVREAQEESGLEIFNLRLIMTDVSEGGPKPFLTTAFVADWRGEPRGSNEGDVAWVYWEKVLSGPFGAYHMKLLRRLVAGR